MASPSQGDAPPRRGLQKDLPGRCSWSARKGGGARSGSRASDGRLHRIPALATAGRPRTTGSWFLPTCCCCNTRPALRASDPGPKKRPDSHELGLGRRVVRSGQRSSHTGRPFVSVLPPAQRAALAVSAGCSIQLVRCPYRAGRGAICTSRPKCLRAHRASWPHWGKRFQCLAARPSRPALLGKTDP